MKVTFFTSDELSVCFTSAAFYKLIFSKIYDFLFLKHSKNCSKCLLITSVQNSVKLPFLSKEIFRLLLICVFFLIGLNKELYGSNRARGREKRFGVLNL